MQHWTGVFGYPKKSLVDHGGEFSKKVLKQCESFNVSICATATESPWNRGLIERHNAIIGSTVTKITEKSNCDEELVFA